jgi:hypothetical protein
MEKISLIFILILACGSDPTVASNPLDSGPDRQNSDADSEIPDSGAPVQDSKIPDVFVQDSEIPDVVENRDSESGSDSSVDASDGSLDDSSASDGSVNDSSVDAGSDHDGSDTDSGDANTDSPECITGTKCEDLTVFACVDNFWEEQHTCPYICDTGACKGICNPTEKKCNNKDVEICDKNGQWQPSTTCPYVCESGACTGECVPEDKDCSELVPQTCNSRGEWIDGSACPFVCANGICTGECVPTSKKCSDKIPQTCDSNGFWQSGAACTYVCASGDCTGVCVPNTHRCDGLKSQTCSPLGQWATDQTCPFVCTGAGNCTGECVPTSKDCQDDVPRTCDSNGFWQSGSTCTYVCLSGTCTGVCEPYDTRCSDEQIQTCNTLGEWGTPSNCDAVPGADSYCAGDVCTFDCNLDYDNCDENPANGCETNLNTDGNHCGYCHHSCCGGACGSGTCGVYDTDFIPYNHAYDVDSNNIYWAPWPGSELKQQSRIGNSLTLSSNQNYIAGVSVFGSNVFWGCYGTTPSTGGVFSTPKNGGLTTTYSINNGKDFLIATSTDIFHTRNDKADIWYIRQSDNFTSLVLGATLHDGSIASVTYRMPFVTDGTYLYATYVSYPSNQKPIVRTPIHGGPITIFANYPSTPGWYNYAGLSTDGTNLYYVSFIGMEPANAGIYKQPFAGGFATKLVGNGNTLNGTTATDGVNVYYASGTPREIRKIPVNGGVFTTIAYPPGTGFISDMKVANECVYWIASSDNTIYAVAVSP